MIFLKENIPSHLQHFFVPTVEIGLESTLKEYIDNLVEIFEEVKRVLKPSGTFWLNIGDTYSNFKDCGSTPQSITKKDSHSIEKGSNHSNDSKLLTSQGFKDKDLMMVPARLAIALQESGWFLRQDIIWAKATSGKERSGSCMPESVKDRFVSAHEHIFLLTKKSKYYFDSHAVKEAINVEDDLGNMRNVWRVNLSPGSSGQHIAGYPEKLVEPCVKSGTSEFGCCSECGKPHERILERMEDLSYDRNPGIRHHKLEISQGRLGKSSTFLTDSVQKFKSIGWKKTCKCESEEVVPSIVLDPFMGSGTTALVSLKLGRNFIGFDLNPEYIEFAKNRIIQFNSEKRYF